MPTPDSEEPNGRDPVLSVIMASDGARSLIPDRLQAVARACRGLAAEVVLVSAPEGPVSIPADPPIPTRSVTARSGLVPVQWGCGIEVARGSIVALTTTQFRVREGWAYALLQSFETDGVVGVGGRMSLARDAGYVGTAVYFVRYSEHMSTARDDAPQDPAGENAAYERRAVVAACPDLSTGFWEVDAHRRLRSDGGALAFDPDVVSEYAPVVSLGDMLLNRFVHGGHFGTYRVRSLGWPRWRAITVTPLVPVVLLLRILQRVRRSGRRIGRFMIALPAIILLLVAWAAGEAHGALRSGSPADDVG